MITKRTYYYNITFYNQQSQLDIDILSLSAKKR